MIAAYFYRALDARLAISALREMGVEPSDPIWLTRPENGRDWKVEITLETGSLAERYSRAELANQVVGLLRRFNGATDVPSRV